MELPSQIMQTYDLLHEANQQIVEIWLRHVLFTWRWWLGVFLTFIPWILWWRIRPKESTARVLYVMFFVIIVVSWLDFMGSTSFGLWHYYYEVVPYIPSYIPWDWSMIPVMVALFIQYKPNLNSFLKAMVFGGIFAFIGEPLFIGLNMYEPEHWRHVYSFLIMIVIYLIANYLSKAESYKPL